MLPTNPATGKRARDLVRKRSQNTAGVEVCETCYRHTPGNFHHILNRSQGGPDTASNLLYVCGSGTTGCHGWITRERDKARGFGWAAMRSKDPEQQPGMRVRLARYGWVRLADDGKITQLKGI